MCLGGMATPWGRNEIHFLLNLFGKDDSTKKTVSTLLHVVDDLVAKSVQVGGQRRDSSGVVDQEGISFPDLGRVQTRNNSIRVVGRGSHVSYSAFLLSYTPYFG
jgi:hypothetical protein